MHGGSDPTFPNPDLEPETSNNYEAGARFDNGALSLDLAVFLSNAEDYITTESVTGGRQFTNVDTADTHGAEVAAAYTFAGSGLTPYASGTWLKRHYDSGSYETWDTGHPEFSGRAGVRYDRDFAERGLGFFADLYVRAATEAYEELSDGSTETYESWQTVNLSMGTKFGAERQHFVSLNLLNTHGPLLHHRDQFPGGTRGPRGVQGRLHLLERRGGRAAPPQGNSCDHLLPNRTGWPANWSPSASSRPSSKFQASWWHWSAEA